jgi:lipopolysaccharide transport system permease protein
MIDKDITEWSRVINSKSNGVFSGLKDIGAYKDLVYLFSRRDLVAIYKQTILGPLWLILQPFVSAFAFMVIFGNLMGVQTGGYPKFLFYYSALVFWTLFSEILQKTTDTFTANADLFSKVFFPRIVIPFSIIITALVKFSFSLLILLSVWIYYFYDQQISVDSFLPFLLLPLVILTMVVLGTSFGLIFSAITVRYRDFKFLLQFGLQLLMYFSPVIFPLSMVQGKLAVLIYFNPVSGVIEAVRSILLGGKMPDMTHLSISLMIGMVCMFIGLALFSKVQRNFIDTI